ncbi:MAG: hypothetical protein K0Q50_2080 [Vampirovibrio sp.]|jgi:Cdc6-like AAA superfamily ATPase|nr:hypothetical protein [Vampirovibrio sp.]
MNSSKYNPEQFKIQRPEFDKYKPYLLDENPFPDEPGIGAKNFTPGRIRQTGFSEDVPFSVELRKNELASLDEILNIYTANRAAKILWVCGEPGVGKSTLLQYYFNKPFMTSSLLQRSLRWYMTYEKREERQFLRSPFKYLVESFYQNLLADNPIDKIFHDAIAGTIYKFIVDENTFNTYKVYLPSVFSPDEIKAGIESEGAEYIENLLNTSDESQIEQFIQLLEVVRNAGILPLDKDYFDKFLAPFIRRRLESTFLIEEKTHSYLVPTVVESQEIILRNTIKLLTSGAFDHFILVLDQIDIAWNKSKTAPRRKDNFLTDVGSLIRQLHHYGFILILAVTEQAKQDINKFMVKESPEGERIFESRILTVPQIQNDEQVATILKEYLSKNPYRQKATEEQKAIAEKSPANPDLFPFDKTACAELLKRSNKSTDQILKLARTCLNECADALKKDIEKGVSPKDSEFFNITGKVVRETVRERMVVVNKPVQKKLDL